MALQTIGVAGDFPTMALWEASLPSVLTEPEIGRIIDLDHSADTANVIISGITTTAANRVILEGIFDPSDWAAGSSIIPLAPNYNPAIVNDHVTVRDLIFDDRAALEFNSRSLQVNGGYSDVRVERCVFLGAITTTRKPSPLNLFSPQDTTFENCVFDSDGYNFGTGVASADAGVVFRHCLSVGPRNGALGTSYGFNGGTCEHCYAGGQTGAGFLNNDAVTGCASEDATADLLTGVDPVLQFVTYTSPIESCDLHLVQTSALIGAGSLTPTPFDWDGDARNQSNATPGQDEFVIVGGAETVTPTAWIVLTTEDQPTAWHVRTEQATATGWRVRFEQATATAWRVLGQVATATGWRIRGETSTATGWRVRFEQATATAWRILSAGVTSTTTAWRVRTERATATGWRVRFEQATATAWRILGQVLTSTATGWRIRGETSTATGWRVRLERATATAWRVLGQVLTSTATGWRIKTQRNTSAAWRVRTETVTSAAWRLIIWRVTVTAWRLGVIDINPARVVYAFPRERTVRATRR